MAIYLVVDVTSRPLVHSAHRTAEQADLARLEDEVYRSFHPLLYNKLAVVEVDRRELERDAIHLTNYYNSEEYPDLRLGDFERCLILKSLERSPPEVLYLPKPILDIAQKVAYGR
ncbi:MAG TPA: hypothetical protein VJB66_01435 [Candidatus Nanoarchaeia archaeon]|nr:hypothetical protein [Candidatus Nanoarchaeia archaeon]